MKIVIDGRMLLSYMTGIGRYISGLAKALSENPDGNQYTLWLQSDIKSNHPIWKIQNDHFHLRQLPLTHLEPHANWVLPKVFMSEHADLYHCAHFDVPFFMPGRVVSTVHDIKYIQRPNFFPEVAHIKRYLLFIMVKFSTRRSKKIITVSNFTRQDLCKIMHVNANKVTSIPHGVDHKFFQQLSIRNIHKFQKGKSLSHPYILFVGERRPHKNISGLINAYAKYQLNTNDPHHLIVAGKQYSNYQEPEMMVHKMGMEQHVHFLEYVPDEELPALYQAASALVLPSFYEGFGLPVLEAMASGTPVIAANNTSLSEVVSKAGILVPANDPEQLAQALVNILPGGKQREHYIKLGRKHAEKFTWESCARSTLAVYREALEA